MKTILINVNYRDKAGKFWQDSYIKNDVINIEMDTIHDDIAEYIKEKDGVELSYKNKPQTNIYTDKNGEAMPIGYIYRGKSDIYDEENREYKRALLDVWVEIREVRDHSIVENITH